MRSPAGVQGPLQLRRELLAGKPRHLRVLNTIAERAGWGNAPKGRYQGLAFMEGYTSCIAQVAEVSIENGELKVHRITCVIDCGQAVNPRIVESQLESGIVYGLSAALWGDITICAAAARSSATSTITACCDCMRPPDSTSTSCRAMRKPGGIGETGVPPVAPALCNAIFAATGKRLRSLPIAAHRLT